MCKVLQQSYNLVGGFNPSEKKKSVGVIVPNIWKKNKCSKPATSNQYQSIVCIIHSNPIFSPGDAEKLTITVPQN